MHVNAGALPSGTTHLGMEIAGVLASGRRQVETSGAYTFTFSATNVQTLSRVPRTTLQVDISFWNAASGGSDLGQVSDVIRSLSSPPGPQPSTEAPQPVKAVAEVGDGDDFARKDHAHSGWVFVRYANEAALPSTVPANTIAWFPEA